MTITLHHKPAQVATSGQQSPAAATWQPYPVDNLRRKGGYYIARIDGLDARYGVARDFLQGRPKGGSWQYGPAEIGELPVWLLRAGSTCNGCGRPDPKAVELIAASAIGWMSLGTGIGTRDLITLIEQHPVPGEDPAGQLEAALQDETTPAYGPNDAPF